MHNRTSVRGFFRNLRIFAWSLLMLIAFPAMAIGQGLERVDPADTKDVPGGSEFEKLIALVIRIGLLACALVFVVSAIMLLFSFLRNEEGGKGRYIGGMVGTFVIAWFILNYTEVGNEFIAYF